MPLALGTHVLTVPHPSQDQLIRSAVYIHASCIVNDHTMATFVPPLSYTRMHELWAQHFREASTGIRIIVVNIKPVDSRNLPAAHTDHVRIPFNDSDWPLLPDSTHELAGIATLCLPTSETGPFRALVQNLFVHPFHRRKGTATGLLAELESEVVKNGRWSLMLDTTVGTPAERMYDTLQWNRLGIVKDYGLRPTGVGDEVELADEVWFWKDLRGGAVGRAIERRDV